MAHCESATGTAALEQATAAQQAQVSEEKLAEQVAVLPVERTRVSGQIMPCKGDACPHAFPVPSFALGVGSSIEPNRVRAMPCLPIALLALLCLRQHHWLSSLF